MRRFEHDHINSLVRADIERAITQIKIAMELPPYITIAPATDREGIAITLDEPREQAVILPWQIWADQHIELAAKAIERLSVHHQYPDRKFTAPVSTDIDRVFAQARGT